MSVCLCVCACAWMCVKTENEGPSQDGGFGRNAYFSIFPPAQHTKSKEKRRDDVGVR